MKPPRVVFLQLHGSITFSDFTAGIYKCSIINETTMFTVKQ